MELDYKAIGKRIQSPNRHIRTVAKVEQNRDFAR